MTLRIAAVQADPVPHDPAANAVRAATWIAEAAGRGARLVVFPEAYLTAYDLDAFAGDLPTLDDEIWAPIQQAVDATGTTTIVNTALQDGDDRTLADVVLRPGEQPWAAYAKQHLYDAEAELFTRGDHGTSLTVDGVEVALSVCYDANFPEHAAAAAADGALVYVNSGAYFPGGERRRDLHHAARALDNGIYVVFSGLVGGRHDFVGGTAAFDPLGSPIAQLATGEGLVVADVDPGVVRDARTAQRMWADRRADLGPRHRSRRLA